MIMNALLLLTALAASAVAMNSYKVFYSQTSKTFYTQPPLFNEESISIEASDILVLSGYIANDTTHTGWYRLSLEGVKGVPDALMMGGAGFLEGLLTSPLIDDAIANYAMDTSNKTLMDDLK